MMTSVGCELPHAR